MMSEMRPTSVPRTAITLRLSGAAADDPGSIGSGVLEAIINVEDATLCDYPGCTPTPNYRHIKGLAVWACARCTPVVILQRTFLD